MKTIITILFCFACGSLIRAEKPKASPGFHWKEYADAHCELQVPDGWVVAQRTAGLTQVVLLSPKEIPDGKGIDVGFTMNVVKCATKEQWKDAMLLAGKMMSEARKATEHPVDSRVEDKPDMLFMVLEGERFIPDSPHPEKKYHVRAVVRAFPKYATIYMYSFGAPTEEWEEAWKKGTVIFNPVWFTLRK
jgi:hypothetical protein